MTILELDGGFYKDVDICCDFCGADHEECGDLILSLGKSICPECLGICSKRLAAHRAGLPAPAPARGAMLAMAALMQAAASALDDKPGCPWCGSLDIREAMVVSLNLNRLIMSNVCGRCGAWEVEAGEDISTLTPEEMKRNWHKSPRREFTGMD